MGAPARRSALLAVVALAALVVAAPSLRAQDGDGLDSGRKFFDRFVAKGRAYDPTVANLYADHAVIQNVRRYSDGTTRRLELTGIQYKHLIRAAMPVARRRGDRDSHSGVSLVQDGHRTRIRSTRYNEMKQYASPFEMVLERSGQSWPIVEERSESQP